MPLTTTLRSLAVILVASAFVLSPTGRAEAAATPPASVAQYSSSFGTDNAEGTVGASRTLLFPAGATYLPPTPGDFYSVMWVRVNDSMQYGGTKAEIIGGVGNSSATGGNDRQLYLKRPAPTAEIGIKAQAGGSAWWLGANPTAITAHPDQKICIVFGQIGGGQFIAANEVNGTPLPNSPAVSLTSNMGATSFWKNAGVPRTQAAIGNFLSYLGAPLNSLGYGHGGDLQDFAFLWGTFPNAGGTPSVTALEDLCSGATPISSLPGTLRYHAPLNDPGTFAANPAGAITAAMTQAGSGGITKGSPIYAPSAIKLLERGDGYVFRVERGESGVGATGTIYIQGTYEDDGGGLPTAIEARITDAGGSTVKNWQTIDSTLSDGSFAGAIDEVPVGGPYFVSVRYENSPERVYASAERTFVGLVLGFMGQSQLSRQFGTGTATTLTDGHFSRIGTDLVIDPEYHASVLPVTLGAKIQGDGVAAILGRLRELSGGWPVMTVDFTRPGHPVDAFAYDDMQVAQSLPGTSFAGALTFTHPFALTNPIGVVKAGSLAITSGGQAYAIDNGSGQVVTGEGAIIGSINYATRLLTVSGLPSGASVTWKVAMDTVNGSGSINNPLTGFTVWGDEEDPGSGGVVQIWSRVEAPLSTMTWWQGTSNMNEFNSIAQYPVSSANYQGRLAMVRERLNQLDGYDPQTPFVIMTQGREGIPAQPKIGNLRRAHYEQSISGGVYRFGGTYVDMSLDNGSGPHQNTDPVTGSPRVGRRMAQAIWAAQTDQPSLIQGPEAVSALFVAGSNRSQIDVAFKLSGGTALATQSGVTTGLKGWRAGSATAPSASDFSAALVGTSTVRLTRNAGSWVDGTVVDYLYGQPFWTSANLPSDLADMATLVYDNRGGFGGKEPGLPALPIFVPMTVAAETGPPPSDTIPPVISAITPSVASDWASVSWTTNEPATASLEHGTSVSYGTATTSSALAMTRTFTVAGLTPSTTYHYRVTSTDAAGNTSTSNDFTFTTMAGADTTAPTVTNTTGSAYPAGTVNVPLTVTTNEAASCRFGATAGMPMSSMSVFGATGGLTHAMVLTLASGTHTYYVKCEDAVPNLSAELPVSFTVAADEPPPVGDASLVLHYSFDASSISGTTVQDLSGNNHPGTMVASPVLGAGRIGDALEFNGTSHVNVGTASLGTTDTYTLSFWVKVTGDNPSVTDAILARGTSVYPFMVQVLNTGALRFGNRTSSTVYLNTTGKITTGQWAHAAIVYSQGSRQLYLNGVLSGSDTMTGTLNWSGNNPLIIGRRTVGSPDGFVGALDDLRHYNRALTTSEIQQLAQ